MLFRSILELGEQMKSVGLLIMLDNIMNRVMENRKRGIYTRVYIDESHLFFKNPYSAEFLLKAWRRFRKYGGLLTGITQNVEECLKNDTARWMISNCEFLLIFNQSPSDRAELASMLNISPAQMGYITNSSAGRGLIKVGGSIVPFQMGVSNFLLYDGFFSFAVVRQSIIQYLIQCFQ